MHCTVLMPAHNTSPYITEAINSVYNQIYKDWDLLVIDDGSTDNTPDIVEYLGRGKNVSIVRLKENKGVAEATRIGLEMAIGPIVTVVDSDDLIYNWSLSTVVPEFNKKKLGFAWTQFIRSNGRQGWSRELPPGVNLFKALTKRKWWCCSHQRFLRKSVYLKSPRLRGDFRYSSDYQLALVMGATGCKTKYINQVTYWYRQSRAGSISSNKSRAQRDCVQSMIKWANSGFVNGKVK